MSQRLALARHHLAIYVRPREIECKKEKSVSIIARIPLALTCGPVRIGKSAIVSLMPLIVP